MRLYRNGGLTLASIGILDFLIEVWLTTISRKIKHKYDLYQIIHISSTVAWLQSEDLKKLLIQTSLFRKKLQYIVEEFKRNGLLFKNLDLSHLSYVENKLKMFRICDFTVPTSDEILH